MILSLDQLAGSMATLPLSRRDSTVAKPRLVFLVRDVAKRPFDGVALDHLVIISFGPPRAAGPAGAATGFSGA